MNQTLPKENRKHPKIYQTDEQPINLHPNTILVYDVFKPGDGSAVGFIGIIDQNETYNFSDKVFFKEDNLKITEDFEIPNNSDSVCGYINVNKVSINCTNLPSNKPKKIISLAEKKRRNFLNSLSKDEKEIINMYYKIRVITMERKQGTTPLETALLDKVEYMKSKFGVKFNPKNYMKGIAKKYNFKYEKLNSGYLKRIVCRRWAKVDFLKSRMKSKD